jgi:putative peptidoglycan lipid II flippase
MGLVRTVVAAGVLGVTYLGNTYASANSMPNLLFEIAAGGALAAVLVPSLSRALARGDVAGADDTASAFANIALLALTPVVAAGLLLRRPLMLLLTSGVADPAVRADEVKLGAFLLLFFIPQVWLYAVGIVLTGVLHSRNRFSGPALAPLLSSLVVTASYLVYAAAEGGEGRDLGRVTGVGKLILGAGTTLGVAVLSLSLLIPARRLGIRWRPVVRLDRSARETVQKLLTSALVAVAAQQLMLGVVLVAANRVAGGVVAYQLAFTILLLPWAVLAVPVATTAFPGMAAAVGRDDSGDFAARCSDAVRSVMLVTFAAAAVLFAAATPVSRLVLLVGAGSRPGASMLPPTVAAFAPGLVGYGLFALLTRAFYARGDGRSPATGAAAGFGIAIACNVVAVKLFHGSELIAALGASFSIGMTAAGALMLVRLARSSGAAALSGVVAAVGRGLIAALASAPAGRWAARVASGGGVWSSAAGTIISSLVVVAVYVLIQRLLGDREIARLAAAWRETR